MLHSARGFSQYVPLIPSVEHDSVCVFGTKHYLQNVVTWAVAEVPHADLRAHVPATEGAASELQAADLH